MAYDDITVIWDMFFGKLGKKLAHSPATCYYAVLAPCNKLIAVFLL